MTVEAIERLTEDWRNRGGYLDWGNGAQAVAFPSVRAGGEQYWPWTIRPTTGAVEVVFQHLLSPPPFGDTALRDELRRRINRIRASTCRCPGWSSDSRSASSGSSATRA